MAFPVGLKAVAVALPPPVGEASVQLISGEILAFRLTCARGDWIIRHTISSITSSVGAIGPFFALSIATNTLEIPEKSERLKVARKAVLPVQCLR